MTDSKYDMSSIKYPNAPFFSDRPKLPKVKYSDLTEADRLWLARETGYELVDDIYFGRYSFYKTNAWYNPLLRVVKDLGYDTTELQITDWNNIKDVVDKFHHIISDIERRLKQINEERNSLYLEQVIFDS